MANRTRPDQSVAIQQKICTPADKTIVMLAAVKKPVANCGNPVVNM